MHLPIQQRPRKRSKSIFDLCRVALQAPRPPAPAVIGGSKRVLEVGGSERVLKLGESERVLKLGVEFCTTHAYARFSSAPESVQSQFSIFAMLLLQARPHSIASAAIGGKKPCFLIKQSLLS